MIKSDKLYELYWQSSQKFDYFMTGLSIAVFVYSIQSLDLNRYSSYLFLVPIAWIFLLISVIAGIIRIELSVTLTKGDAVIETMQSAKAKIDIAKIEKQKMDDLNKEITDFKEKQLGYIKYASWAYRVNQIALLAGISLLGFLKILNI
ncbi:MAG: hypothetical protein M1147_12270 [Nitrospirae bacterium]|nr:hypothetical protein [Nitrospirota bacterium]MCL5978866.1 hypothetical protein [Nitrospirota bacterium]